MSFIKKIFAVAAIMGFTIGAVAADGSQKAFEDNKSFIDRCGFTGFLFFTDSDIGDFVSHDTGSGDNVYGRLLGTYTVNDAWSIRAAYNYSYSFFAKNDAAKDGQLEDPLLEVRWSGKMGIADATHYIRPYLGFSDKSKGNDLLSRVRHVMDLTFPTTLSTKLTANFNTLTQTYIYESNGRSGNEFDIAFGAGIGYEINDNFSIATETSFGVSDERGSSLNRGDFTQSMWASIGLGFMSVVPKINLNLHNPTAESTTAFLDIIIPIK